MQKLCKVKLLLFANPVVYEQTHEHALQMGKPNAAYDIIDLLKNICKKGN